MIKSMTGYAAAEVIDGDISVTADIRSVNGKHLDLVLRLPSAYMGLEEKVKGLFTRKIIRGRIEVRIQIKDGSEGALTYEIDWARAEAMYDAISQLTNKLGLQNDITVDHLLGVGGIIKPVDAVDNSESKWQAVEACLTRAIEDLESMRCKEGGFIADDLSARLVFIETCLTEIKNNSANLLEQYQGRLMERIAVLTRETVEIDPARLAQEAAYLADRSDISEEIVRAESHIEQFRHIMQSKEPGGRKLNFLLQELHREFNTMGSKIGHAETAHKVVEVKAELEKIREQIQNVE